MTRKLSWKFMFTYSSNNLFTCQVYLPAITGHVPPQMVHAISSFMEFCYQVRCSVLDDKDLEAIDAAVAEFHQEHVAFNMTRPDGYSQSWSYQSTIGRFPDEFSLVENSI